MTDRHAPTDHPEQFSGADRAVLEDAFAELEHRADTYADWQQSVPSGDELVNRRSRRRPVLVAASVAVVAGVAVTIAAVAGSGSGTNHGAPAGASGGRTSHVAQVVHAGPPTSGTPTSGTAAQQAQANARAAALKAEARAKAAARAKMLSAVPSTAQQVADRLKAVLGGKASFTWQASAGKKSPVISGVLTNTDTGREGGFDIQTMILSPGDPAQCEDADLAGCRIQKLPGGASLWVGKETRGEVLYLVDYVTPEGVGVLMHLSNSSDPKGGGQTLATEPPLSTKQVVAIVESPKWETSK